MLPYVTIHLHILHLVAVHCVFISPIPYISLGRKIHLASNFFQLMGEGEIFLSFLQDFTLPLLCFTLANVSKTLSYVSEVFNKSI